MQELYCITPHTCRLCLSESEFHVPIFGDTSQKLGIHFKIQSCFPALKVSQFDGLPDNICYRCVCALERTYEFWTKCCTTETILKNRQVKMSCRPNHQENHNKKIISPQSREATSFPLNSDDTEWDEWFIWDATYKVSQFKENCPQHMSFTIHNENTQPSVIFEDTNKTETIKHNEDFFKNDFLHEDTPQISEKNDLLTFHAMNKSDPKMNSNNFSSSFWKKISSNSKEHLNIFKNPLYSPINNNNSLKKSGYQEFNEISHDIKYSSELLNHCTYKEIFPSNKEVIQKQKQNQIPPTNTNRYDDIMANAAYLLQRFRTNNSLYY